MLESDPPAGVAGRNRPPNRHPIELNSKLPLARLREETNERRESVIISDSRKTFERLAFAATILKINQIV